MSMLSRILCTYVQTVLVLSVLTFPYRERLRYSLLPTLGLIFGYSFFYTVPYLFLHYDLYKLGYWHLLTSCANTFFFSLVIAFLTRLPPSVALFSTFLVRDLTDAVMLASRLLHIFCFPDTPLSDCIIPLIYVSWLLVLFPFLFHFIRHNIKPNISPDSLKTWRYLWTMPVTFYIFFRLFADVEYLRKPLFWSIKAIALPFAWFTGVILSHAVILKMMREVASVTAVKEQLRYSTLIAQLQEKEVQLLQDNIQETRKLRHDMRHHLVVLEGYLQRNNTQPARDYLRRLIRSVDLAQTKIYCQNHVANALINYYAQKAESSGILFVCSAEMNEEGPLPDTDFSAILGNLLENAYEACVRKGGNENFISLKLGSLGNGMLILSVSNSYSGEIRQSNGGFVSAKHEGYGIGTSSVNLLVHKYDGISKFTYKDGIFEASVLLNSAGPNTRPAE